MSRIQDPDAEDAAQIMRALSVHRHCGSQVRVIVELLKPEKQVNAIWDDTKNGIEIICPDAIRFKAPCSQVGVLVLGCVQFSYQSEQREASGKCLAS